MDSGGIDALDPFQDQILAEDPAHPVTDTLTVGRDASLTLGTESLVVLDAGLSQQQKGRCCGLLPPTKSSPTRTIPYFNILWAELTDLDITIHHASPLATSKSAASPTLQLSFINYPITKTDLHIASGWVEALLARAYAKTQKHKRIKVLINPFGGSGSAAKRYYSDIEPIFAAAKCVLDVERTTHIGHAREIAHQVDVDAFDVIASCSGDGLPHEVFNGLGDKENAAEALRKIAVVQLPCGTGNAMSWNLNGTDSPSLAALCIVKGIRTPLDLVSITQGPPGQERRSLSFLSQSVGIVAETDLGTENIRWLGDARFTYGFLVRLISKTVYPCQLAVKVVEDDKELIRARCKSYRTEDRPKRDDLTPIIPRDTTTSSVSLLDDSITTASSSYAGTSQTNQSEPQNDTVPSAQNKGLPPLQHGTINSPLPSSWPPLIPWPTLGNFYSGNMGYMSRDANFFQAALPADGCLDLVCIDGKIPRLASVKSLVAVSDGTFFDMRHVLYRKVEAYRILPQGSPRSGPWPGDDSGTAGSTETDDPRTARKAKKDGYISIDGEHFPFEPFQVEVHRALGTVLSRSGKTYETPPLQ